MEENSRARDIHHWRQQALIEKQQHKALAQAEKLQKKQKKKDKDCVIV